MVSFGSKDCIKEQKLECAYFRARLASFGHLGLVSDPLIISKFHNETHVELQISHSQISHRVKNWYQNITFGKCEICVWSILIILGV